MKITRRNFVFSGCSAVWGINFFIASSEVYAKLNKQADRKILVLIHLAGGNDWLNTVIPYTSSDYYHARPNLAIDGNSILSMDDTLGLHPAMAPLKTLYDQGKMAVFVDTRGIDTTFSHHKAIEAWQYASRKDSALQAWQGRYADFVAQNSKDKLSFPTINVQPGFLRSTELGDEVIVSNLTAANKFEFDVDVHYRLNQGTKQKKGHNSGFAQSMKMIGQSIKEKSNATIYNISLGGFDTHSNQLPVHSLLLKTLSEGIANFQKDMERAGLAENVLTVVYSEFGRQLKENDDQGTDHGHTNNILVIGNQVKGGIYGNYGNPQDWRCLHTTLLDRWLDCPAEAILGEKLPSLSFV